MLGGMQDWPLRIMRILDHAEREHGRREIVSRWAAGSETRPDWAGTIALHHGSLDRARRDWVEDGLRTGKLRCVVATSSLDLGVDFSPVDRGLQIVSPK